MNVYIKVQRRCATYRLGRVGGCSAHIKLHKSEMLSYILAKVGG